MRIVRAAGLLVVALAGVAVVGDRVGYRPEPWLEDLDALEAHMGLAYANLEWMAGRRGLDLADLDRRTRASIRTVGSRRGAHSALEEFVAAFADPHFRIDPPPLPVIGMFLRRDGGDGDQTPEDEPSFAPDAPGRDICESFGYRDRDHDFEFDVDALPGWSSLPDDGAFPAGVFQLPGGPKVGLLRIEHFGEDGYRSACAAAWDAEAAERRTACDGECLDRFRLRASDALARDVARRVEVLSAQGVDTLVLDVTGNGGGTEWVDPVTRIFSSRPLRAMRVTTVRHPRGIEPMSERLAAVESALADSSLPEGTRALLAEARERLAAVRAELRAPCDRSAMWQGRDPGCRQTIESPSYTTGVFDWLPAGALAGYEDRAELYSPFGRDVPSGVWSGPLVVLADRGSASATEALVAMLKDNGAATVIGERTYGAGCGYTDGGLPLTLPNSGLDVWMPDCARYRIDGTNEIEGIEPDVPIPWSELGGRERARALADALSSLR